MKHCVKKMVAIALFVGMIFNTSSYFAADEEPYSGAYEREAFEQTPYNYAEALQKTIYFYDANKCGVGVTGGALDWRGDCHVEDSKKKLSETNLKPALFEQYKDIFDPDGDGCIDVSGGFHDAGDHVRFGMPQSYAFSTLGWGFNEFREAYKEIGQEEHMLDILKWFSDCYLRCTFRDDNGDVIAFCYMVGEGGEDHRYWESPELQTTKKLPRPADFATAENPASDQCAAASAGLALMCLNYKDIDKEYADKCLDTAKALYEFARKYKGLGNGDGFYSSGGDEDDLAWAAVWLYEATKNMDYIYHIDSVSSDGIFTGYMKDIISTTENTWQNIWVHCWDVVWGGVFTKLACMFPENERFDYFAKWNLEYWTGGFVKHENKDDISYLAPTKAGYAMINTWGSARYNTAAQLCTMAYQKYHPECTKLTEWAKRQMNYLMGDNPMHRSYIVGFTDNYAEHPHHRAAHGSTTLSMLNPVEHSHMLWGALVGGPDSNDKHVDVTYDYVYNEVAIDYNAAVVGALAGQYLLYERGDKALENFPPKEEEIEEFYAETRLEQINGERTQVSICVHNETVHPPRLEDGMSCRYYFNIKELLEAGQSIDDIKMEIYYDEARNTEKIGPVKVDDNGNYYLEFRWSQEEFHGDREIQFALIAKQDSNWKSHWDGTNDWSFDGLIKSKNVKTKNIPVYVDDTLVYGEEPQL